MSRDIKKSSVATKMIFTIIVVTLFVAAIASAIILSQDYEKYLQRVEQTMEEAKESFMKPLSVALYSEDEDQVNNALNGILKLEGLVEVRIMNIGDDEPAFSAITSKKEGKYKKMKVAERRSLGPSREIKIIHVDPDDPDSKGEHIATMFLNSTKEVARDKIVTQIKKFGIVQLSQVIVLAIAIFLIFRSLVARHLKLMADFAQAMDLNDLSGPGLALGRKRPTSNDELQDLSDSFNEMRDNLKKAHAELKDYADNLEDKVKAATKEIEEEKQKVANLLNNMKQAIFSIDSQGIIVGPVSAFSKVVFDGDVEGNNVYETLYKDMDTHGEEYATLKTSMLSVFGEDDLQYDLMEDNFPNRIEFKAVKDSEDKKDNLDPELISEEEDDVRILSVNYNPMWDSNDCLEQLMIVVEDITEKEKLEAEVAKQKKESEKNISIITEMANADLEDISTFLKSSPDLVQSTMDLSRVAHENTAVLGEMFRHLHTLKGNARAFNFNSISSLTHVAETIVTTIREKKSGGENVTQDLFIPLISKLYDINSEINDYGALAKKVFRIENEFENKLISDIQSFIVTLDHLISKNITSREIDFDLNQPKEMREEAFKDLTGREPVSKENLNRIKRSAHSIKGALRSMNAPEISEMVHKLENEIVKFDDLSQFNLDSFTKDFIVPYADVKDRIKSIYSNSDLNNPYTNESADWINIFLGIFQLSSDINTLGPDEIFQIEEKVEKILTETKSLKLSFLTRMSSELFGFIKMGAEKLNDNKSSINAILKEMWIYASVVSRANLSKIEDDSEKESLIKVVRNLEDDIEAARDSLDHLNVRGSILLSTLRHIGRIGINPKEFFKEAKKCLGKDSVEDYFLFEKDAKTDLKFITADLKTTNMVELPKGTLDLAKQGDPLAEILKISLDENPHYRYIKIMDYSQLLRGFNEVIESQEEDISKKVNTFPVVARNYNRLKEVIRNHSNDEITQAFNRLLDIPIIPSLAKYKTMVNDISTKLNKSVDYKVSGGEVTMNKDSFYLFQDAFVHILRNSLDHGIEDPGEREEQGKNKKGVIHIDCNEVDPENLEIKISDDGKGINAEIIAKKAVEKGIHTENEINEMSKEDIIKLIFVPSFSQKESVDELSGRGVGMDIVEKNMKKLGGDIGIQTEVGKGTTFTLKIKS